MRHVMITAKPQARAERHMAADDAAVADRHVRFNNRVGTDHDPFTNAGAGINYGGGMNVGHEQESFRNEMALTRHATIFSRRRPCAQWRRQNETPLSLFAGNVPAQMAIMHLLQSEKNLQSVSQNGEFSEAQATGLLDGKRSGKTG